MSCTIDDLPDELLEYIFSLVCPYKDLASCKLVCKRWHYTTRRVVRRRTSNFNNSLKNNCLEWEREFNDKLSFRVEFASCFVDGTLYIFGGRSSSETEFNDLAALNLSDRTWKRIISSGNFPSPKSSASMCAYKNQLILYGGYAFPSRGYPFMNPILFNELHVYDIKKNYWTKLSTESEARVTSHSVAIHGNLMIVIGGLISEDVGTVFPHESQTVRCLNLDTFTWSTPKCCGVGPSPLLWQSLIFVDDNNLLVLAHPNSQAFKLTIGPEPWSWTKINNENLQWMPRLMPNHVIRVEDHLIMFGGMHPLNHYYTVEGRQNDPDRPRLSRRLQPLQMLGKFKHSSAAKDEGAEKRHALVNMYMADISDIMESKTIMWREPRFCSGCPLESVYSMFLGYAEVVVIGGRYVSPQTRSNPQNIVFYGKAPKFTL